MELNRVLGNVFQFRTVTAPAKGTDIVPGLTGIRGIAALGVFLCHFQFSVLSFLGINPLNALTFIGNAFRGVDLFFILSGFILFHVHHAEFQFIRRDRLVKFYILRFFRVYPLNTVILLGLLPLVLLPGYVSWHREAHVWMGSYHLRDFSLGGFIQELLLCQTWTGLKLGTWNEPAWTLSAEVLGYSVFPALALFAARQRSSARVTAFAAASLGILALLMLLSGHATNNPSGLFGAIRMAFCFFAGICLCRSFHLVVIPSAIARLITVLSVCVIGICLAVSSAGVFTVFGFAGLIFGLAYQTGPISAIATSRPSMFLGKISFSFYMVHTIPLNIFAWLTKGVTLDDLGLALKLLSLTSLAAGCVLLAFITYQFIEIPFQRLGRHIAGKIEAE